MVARGSELPVSNTDSFAADTAVTLANDQNSDVALLHCDVAGISCRSFMNIPNSTVFAHHGVVGNLSDSITKRFAEILKIRNSRAYKYVWRHG